MWPLQIRCCGSFLHFSASYVLKEAANSVRFAVLGTVDPSIDWAFGAGHYWSGFCYNISSVQNISCVTGVCLSSPARAACPAYTSPLLVQASCRKVPPIDPRTISLLVLLLWKQAANINSYKYSICKQHQQKSIFEQPKRLHWSWEICYPVLQSSLSVVAWRPRSSLYILINYFIEQLNCAVSSFYPEQSENRNNDPSSRNKTEFTFLSWKRNQNTVSIYSLCIIELKSFETIHPRVYFWANSI